MTDFIIKFWLQFAMGLFASGSVAFYRHLWNQQKAIKNGLKALLKDRIIWLGNYYRDKGYCPTYALDMINALYDEYSALGGNGTAEMLREEMKKLPREPKKA